MASSQLPRNHVQMVSHPSTEIVPAASPSRTINQPSPRTTTQPNEDPSSTSTEDTMSTIPPIPVDVLAIIGKCLPRPDQARCLRVSPLFFEAVAPLLWEHMRLSDMRTTRSTRSKISTDLMALVRTLEIDGKHHPTVCQGIGEACTALDQIIFDYANRRHDTIVCTQKVCGSLPAGRPVRLVIHDSETPGRPSVQGVRLSDSADKLPFPRIAHLSVYFRIPDPRPLRGLELSAYQPQLSHTLAPDTMSLVCKPLTLSTMTRSFESWMWSSPPFYIDPALYDDPAKATIVTNLLWDLCSAIALACAVAPKHCTIQIVNLDQMPFHPELSRKAKTDRLWELPPGTEFIVRSIKGEATIIGQASGSRKIDPKKQREAEEELKERMEKVPIIIKRWMEDMLNQRERGDELEERWGNIKFVSLYEYEDLETEKLRKRQIHKYW